MLSFYNNNRILVKLLQKAKIIKLFFNEKFKK